ncbi:hypothetical protein ABK040_012710 [Willaertia magna]
MGLRFSSSIEKSITRNDFLNELCSSEPIRDHDKFWNELAYSSLLSISQDIMTIGGATSSTNSKPLSIVASAVTKSSTLSIGDYFPLALIHPHLLERHLSSFASLLSTNNIKTGSLGSLMLTLSQWLLDRIKDNKEEKEEREAFIITCNALVLFRFLIHKIIIDCEENSSLLRKHLSLPPNLTLSQTLIENFQLENENYLQFSDFSILLPRIFLQSCFLYLSEVKITVINYLVYLEVINCLFSLFSTSLYGGVVLEQTSQQFTSEYIEERRDHNIFLEEAIQIMKIKKNLMNEGLNLTKLIYSLLQNHLSYRLSKTELSPLQKSIYSNFYSIFNKLGETATAIMYLPYNAYRRIFYGGNTKELEYSEKLGETYSEIFSRRSIMVLLLLLFYRKKNTMVINPYLQIFSTFPNSDDLKISNNYLLNIPKENDEENVLLSMDSNNVNNKEEENNSFGISFEQLYQSITRDFEEEECTLLTYSLLHENKSFREFILSRTDSEIILLPLLHKLYHSKESRPNHVYMLLIILTILTQDESFIINIQKLSVNNVPWFKDRILGEIRLASLLVVVLISLVQYNISHQKDLYLNKFCLAIISNLGPYFMNIHTYTAQRLVVLTRLLTLKYEKIMKRSEISDEFKDNYLKLLGTSLEIMNCIITSKKDISGLRKNTRLIYELLYQRRVIKKIEELNLYPDYIHNIKLIINYFDEQITNIMKSYLEESGNIKTDTILPLDDENTFKNNNEQQEGQQDEENVNKFWSVETCMECIYKASQFWTTIKAEQQLRQIPHYSFQFNEDEGTESFLYTYLWNIIVRNCDSICFLVEDEEEAEHDKKEETIQITTQ